MKKRPSLFAILFSFIFFSQVNATIVYTDITDATLKKDPDAEPWENAELEIDIDNDGVSDFKFETHFIAKMAYNGADVVTVSEEEWDVIKGLEANTSIDANTGFNAFVDAYLNAGFGTYVFPSNQDQYLGVRFTKNTNTHYGWIKIELTDDGVIFKEYAYESVANTAIKAGAKESPTPTGISQSLSIANVSIYPNPAHESLNIESAEPLTEISIMDLTGIVIKNISITQGTSTRLSVEELQAGLYYIMIRSGSKSMTGKFYKN